MPLLVEFDAVSAIISWLVNGIEKASVELVGYNKIDVPANSTVSATVIVDKSEMRTYDANGAKTYIVDAGDYYFTRDLGDQLNSIFCFNPVGNRTQVKAQQVLGIQFTVKVTEFAM